MKKEPWAPHPILCSQDPPKIAHVLDSGCNSIEDSISNTPIKQMQHQPPPLPTATNDDACFYNSIDMVNAKLAGRINNINISKVWTGKSQESSSGNNCGKSFNLAQMINQQAGHDHQNASITVSNSYGS